MVQLVIKFTNILHSKALQNIPKWIFFGLKINHLATLLTTTGNKLFAHFLFTKIAKRRGQCYAQDLRRFSPTFGENIGDFRLLSAKILAILMKNPCQDILISAS
jgi:hypothetical protein